MTTVHQPAYEMGEKAARKLIETIEEDDAEIEKIQIPTTLKVRSSCGCTVPTWPRKPIMPGQEETIKVKYDTRRMGRIYKSITIYSNAKNSPVVARITGEVVKEVQMMPEKEQAEGMPSAGK